MRKLLVATFVLGAFLANEFAFAAPAADKKEGKTEAVAKDANAIGFDSIGFTDSTVSVVSLGGVMPSSATVKDKTYLLSRNLFVFTKGAPSSLSAKLIDYLRSKSCQEEIVVKEGYVSFK